LREKGVQWKNTWIKTMNNLWSEQKGFSFLTSESRMP
jgi:hypothetical protein